MRIVLLYPPPWKIPAPGEKPEPPHLGGPPFDDNIVGDERVLPYGLLCLAAQARRAGHEVELLNLYTFAWPKVVETIRGLAADIFGLSCFTCNRRGVSLISGLIKQIYPCAFIVVGGPHASALPQEMLEHHEAIDGIVIGEGEATFCELIDRLSLGEPLQGMHGMALRIAQGVVIGPPRARIDDLDTICSPYQYYSGHIIISARGCPGNCTFCGSRSTWGRKVRFHSAKYTVDMLEQMVTVHKQRAIAIKDDTFTCNRKRVLKVCEDINRRGLNFVWSCDTRVDTLDEELLLAMRKAGCQRISFGVESGSPDVLASINKNITIDKVIEVTRIAKKFGFQIRYYMMLGNRVDSAETLKASMNLIVTAKPNQFLFAQLSLFPGTREFEIARDKGMASTDMFFLNPDHSFHCLFLKEDNPEARQIVKWIENNSGVFSFWEYSVSERQAILELLPGLPSTHMDLGGAHYREGNLTEAERYVRQAIDMGYPMPGLGYNYLACIAADKGDFDQAVLLLEQAKNLGVHYVVWKNIEAMRTWADSRGRGNKRALELLANHDFEKASVVMQPIWPAPIQ